jgi:hypothetical protein
MYLYVFTQALLLKDPDNFDISSADKSLVRLSMSKMMVGTDYL